MNTKTTVWGCWLLLLGPAMVPLAARAQSVGIGTATPDAKAALEIQATDRGLLIPRLTAAQRAAVAAPPQGLMVYQTDVPEGFWYFGGSPGAWVYLNPAPGGGLALPYAGSTSTAGTAFAVANTSAIGTGVQGSTVGGSGVLGTAGTNGGNGVLGRSGSGYGVRAISTSSAGLYATTNDATLNSGAVVGLNTNMAALATGVYGETLAGYGVLGRATASGGNGAAGTATDGYGVQGSSNTGIGVRAISSSNAGVYATTNDGNLNSGAVVGRNTNAGGSATGLYGETTGGYGVVGRATASGGFGVGGFATDSYGVYATSNSAAAVQATTSTNVQNQAAVVGLNSNNGGSATGVYGETTGGYGVVGKATASGGWGVSGAATDGYGLFGTSASGSALRAISTSGYGAQISSNTNTAVYASTTNNTLGQAAVLGINSDTGGSATGVYGATTNGYGVIGQATGSGYGLTGLATSGLGVSAGATTGTGVLGASGSGVGVRGTTQSFSQTNAAVWGENTSTSVNGIGVRGISKGGYGVYGSTSFNNSTAVYGKNTGGSGFIGVGVTGETNAQYGAAIQGIATGGADAGNFLGTVNVGGTLNVSGSKNFRIDHPLDPAHQYLYHSCIESPDMMNVYNGNITLDATGAATVLLPTYFEALNRDFRYQLTPLGQAGPGLFVAQEVARNTFGIAGGAPGGRVSWQVTGIRQDKAADRYRTVPEVAKEPQNQGRYLLPEAYGQPASAGIGAWPSPTPDRILAPVAPAALDAPAPADKPGASRQPTVGAAALHTATPRP